MDRDVGELVSKDLLAVGVPFNELLGLEAAKPARRKREAADA